MTTRHVCTPDRLCRVCAAPQALCPECGRWVPVTTEGKFQTHDSSPMLRVVCWGSGTEVSE